jgi:hypothetical protein
MSSPTKAGESAAKQLPQIQTVPNRSAWLAGNGGYPEIGPNVAHAKPRRTASELEAEFQVRSGARSRPPPQAGCFCNRAALVGAWRV